VGRYHRHECSRRLIAHRDGHLDLHRILSGNELCGGGRALIFQLLFATSAVLFCFSANGFAQSPIDDVHVTPRVETSKANPADLIDPSLKTHTKPLKAEVNLVLVPVTITDPMNRLVTGLDKENFQLFEGKDVQEIRHFSS